MDFYDTDAFREWVFECEFPAQFSVQTPTVKKEYHYTAPSGECYSQQIAIDEILISYSCIKAEQLVQLRRKIMGGGVEMIFTLQGNTTHAYDHPNQHRYLDGEYNVYYDYDSDDAVEMHPTDGMIETMIIHLSKEYYVRLINQDSPIQQQFMDRITHKERGTLRDKNLAVTPAMRLIIKEIRGCNKLGAVKRIFLEAKVLDLLMMQTEQIEQEESQASTCKLSSYEIMRLTEAKSILEENIASPPTISRLSKLVGINQSRLKRGFKDMFGTTLYRYVYQLRMYRAKSLLLGKDMSVSEAAYEVGYKNPQHFTAAFKKYYGIVPSELKR